MIAQDVEGLRILGLRMRYIGRIDSPKAPLEQGFLTYKPRWLARQLPEKDGNHLAPHTLGAKF